MINIVAIIEEECLFTEEGMAIAIQARSDEVKGNETMYRLTFERLSAIKY